MGGMVAQWEPGVPGLVLSSGFCLSGVSVHVCPASLCISSGFPISSPKTKLVGVLIMIISLRCECVCMVPCDELVFHPSCPVFLGCHHNPNQDFRLLKK